MSDYLPPFYRKVAKRYPHVVEGHDALAAAAHEAGPLDAKTRHLVKLGITIGAGSIGGVQSHVRQALAEGASQEEVEHVALLAASSVGFPAAVAALSWINDVLEAHEG